MANYLTNPPARVNFTFYTSKQVGLLVTGVPLAEWHTGAGWGGAIRVPTGAGWEGAIRVLLGAGWGGAIRVPTGGSWTAVRPRAAPAIYAATKALSPGGSAWGRHL